MGPRQSFLVSASLILLIFLCACSIGDSLGVDISNETTLQSESPSQSVTASQQQDSPPTSSGSSATQEAQTAVTTNTTPSESAPVVPVSGELIITFDFVRQSGSASNQFAVWVEDIDGNLVKTLYATGYTANGGYRDRPDSIALWVERSGLSNMTRSELDTITGATPRSGALSYTWDLTGANGDTVQQGEYIFFVEGTLRWRNFVLYSGVIEIGNYPATVQADANYTYGSSGRYDALTVNSPENDMIGPVTAIFTPQS